MYKAHPYGACSVHTGTTIYPVAGRPYEIIPFFSSTDTNTRPRRLTRAPVDSMTVHLNQNPIQIFLMLSLTTNFTPMGNEEEDAALAAAFAEAAGALRPIQSKSATLTFIISFPPIINRHKFKDSETSANYKSPIS